MKRLINVLKKKGYKLSVAESCTGGLISKLITDVPGASEVFDCAITTYSNESKIKFLGVSPETLKEYGAVSEQTAKEMAKGALSLANADIAVSVTGIAGPSNSGSQKPVGTVCIGLARPDKNYSATFVFAGSRAQIRKMAAKMALNMALGELGEEIKKEKAAKKQLGKKRSVKKKNK